jgi:hypothetical protein
MVKLQISLHEEHFALLKEMAEQNYRVPWQQASWLIACAVSAGAVLAQDEELPVTTGKTRDHYTMAEVVYGKTLDVQDEELPELLQGGMAS